MLSDKEPSDELLSLFDALGRSSVAVAYGLPIAARKRLSVELERLPQRRGLIPFLVDLSLSRSKKKMDVSEFPEAAFFKYEGDERHVRSAVALLRFIKSNGKLDAIEETSTDLLNGASRNARAAAERVVNIKGVSHECAAELLRQMCKIALRRNSEVYYDLLVLLKRIADARQSSMGEVRLTESLALPSLQVVMDS